MKLLICCFYSAFTLFAACILTVRSEAQHCIERHLKDISVEIGDDNPQRVLSFVRDEPGYQVNLQCKWTLQPANYDKPRQMYIRVPVIDFDTNDVSEAQCNVSNTKADVFSLKLKLNDTTYRNESWCSNKSVKVKSQIVNLWDSSYKLALEFRSDDKQVRSNAKGVQVDVQVLGRDYCHRNMLFFEGSCYLITPEPMTPAEAFSIAKNYLGNVFTVPKNRNNSDFFRPFIQQNSARSKELPFKSPLALSSQQLWTGYVIHFYDSQPSSGASVEADFSDPLNNCIRSIRNMMVLFNSSTSYNDRCSRCALSVHWDSSKNPIFTCQSMDLSLPALIEFKQIPATKGDSQPQLFRTCDMPPPQPPAPDCSTMSASVQITIIVVVSLIIILIVLISAAYCYVKKMKSNREQRQHQEAVGDVNKDSKSAERCDLQLRSNPLLNA
uniref:CUB domain-containing protein n=1 Tax=Macrostomum lignano TaxID=282301 RepID=A0A1I8GVV4_9PLAT